jgi:hypothetical protein
MPIADAAAAAAAVAETAAAAATVKSSPYETAAEMPLLRTPLHLIVKVHVCTRGIHWVP